MGGNSRTTLIICCSPSAFNDAETLSTLRFGNRAKTIKNKVRVNVELSPTELKMLLSQAKARIVSYQDYVNDLENELSLWRNGESVPTERWISKRQFEGDASTGATGTSKRHGVSSILGTPTRDMTNGRSTPGLTSPSLQREMSQRSSGELSGRTTPSLPLLPMDKDEREEFLKRENELQDSIAEKETLLADQQTLLSSLKEELSFLKEHERSSGVLNDRLQGELNDTRMFLEKVQFENKEQGISLDGLKEANTELQNELEELKKEVFSLRMQRRDSLDVVSEANRTQRRKEEMMKEMMSSFPELGLQDGSRVNSVLSKLDALDDEKPGVDPVTKEDAEILRAALNESQALSRQTEKLLKARAEDADTLSVVNSDLEKRLTDMEIAYAELLEKKMSEAGGDAEEVRQRMGELMKSVMSRGRKGEESLQKLLDQRETENARLRDVIEEYKNNSSNLKASLPSLSVVGWVLTVDTW